MRKTATRRTFLKLSAAAASVSAARLAHGAPAGRGIGLFTDDNSLLIASAPVQWAVDKLRAAQTAKSSISDERHKAAVVILVAPVSSPMAKGFSVPASINHPDTSALVPGQYENIPALLVTGVDVRGLVYGILELADRIRNSDDPILALHLPAPIIETTPNKVRSVMRSFCSEVEDKPWFYDRAFWTAYLDTLAAARFNRFNLAFGLAYDFPRGVTDDYFHLPYPYLVEVPGYEQVHVEPALQPGERQRNLETLQFIAAETARLGLDFQLGIWTHAYQWTDSPNSAHHIVGLTPQTHAAYCRDALAAVLKACPQITGLTMRIHGESGIPEGSYDFWQTLWEAVRNARTPDGKPRTIELDLHAKGLDQRTIEVARATGMPVKAGAKFWAEHLGLGYHQADIRATEYPKAGVTGTFAVSSGARNFTRYGYGDFYQQGMGLDLLYRVWPGTQRHLLWADPALASGYGRAANFCGAAGLEIMEPLTFKGREGAGIPGGRNAYADASLAPKNLDSAKFELTYLTWGRHLYNPDSTPDSYHRTLRAKFGAAGPALGDALAASSRILPLVTAAWCPSASNHEFWPEMLTPVSILPIVGRPLYTDNPAPHNVSAISPLDPQLFTTIDQHAKDLVSGTKNARYNTSEVIAWLEDLVATSTRGLAAARAAAGSKARTPEFRRAEEDILILNGLGTYYANLFRTALYYAIGEESGVNTQVAYEQSRAAITEALKTLTQARDSWGLMSDHAKIVYTADLSYGSTSWRRGHWADRLTAIDADVTAFHNAFGRLLSPMISGVGYPWLNEPYNPTEETVSEPPVLKQVATPTPRRTLSANHTQPASFHPGSQLALTVATSPSVTTAILWYRHVNHGERWLSTPMEHVESRSGDLHSAAIPAAYTDSPYPLQYYFELRTASAATLHPPLNQTLSNQPYFAIHKRT